MTDGVLPHEVVVVVSDDINDPVERTYYLSVSSVELDNRPPAFTDVPLELATINSAYVHVATAADPDGDALRWSLVDAPARAQIDAQTGRIVWLPLEADIGVHSLQIRVTDRFGASAVESIAVTVHGANLPPHVLTHPITMGVAGLDYTYEFRAEDPEGHALTYSLDESSVTRGMSVDAATGTILWENSTAGTYSVVVTVTDGTFVVGQNYGLVVSASAPNNPPTIEHNPPLIAGVGDVFTYEIVASDSETAANLLTYTLISGPSGMTLDDSVTPGVYNVLSWTPTQQQFDDQETSPATVVVQVSDGSLSAGMRFEVAIRPGNLAPEILSDPVEVAVAGSQYTYDIWATDPADDPLAYSLDSASLTRGMTIDSRGRIRWSPTEGDIATGPHAVTVTVTDDRGGSDSQTFDITVGEDEAEPRVVISVSTPNAGDNYAIGSSVEAVVRATDNVGVTFLGLTVNGTPAAIDGAGKSVIALANTGDYTLVATAKDAAGNVETITTVISVVDPADQDPPTVELLDPESGTIISDPIDLVATVDDDVPGSVAYVLAIAAVGSTEFQVLASGTGAVTSEVLAQLDPTILANGSYVVRLSATDSGGHTASDEITVNVAGNLKLGAFSLTFTDLEIRSAGMPITITRTYNTLDLSEEGDFGYGWKLDLTTTKIKVDHANGSQFGMYAPFSDGTHVTITLPDGTTEGFTFVGQPTATGFLPTNEYLPKFIPDAGVKSKLLVPSYYLLKLGDAYIEPASAEPYSPINPFFGNAFTLQLRNGTELAITADTGELASITDRLGNSTEFTGDGIQTVSPTGEQLVRVEFIRDQAGRIIEIIDPNGKSLHYTYNAGGDLVSFEDREENETTFAYLSGSPHYLESIVDPLGRTAATTEFYEDGRIKKVTDAANKTIEYTYELDEKTQTIKDQMGGYTTIIFDSRGNVIKEIDPVGSIIKRTWSSNDDLLTETMVVGLDDAESSETNDLTMSYEYDSNGNRVSAISPRGLKTLTSYDSFGNPLRVSDEYGNVTASEVGRSGLLSSIRDASGNVTSFAYDSTGNVTQITNTSNRILVTTTYNEFGEITSSTPAAGRTTYFEYDDNGRQTEAWYVATVDEDEIRVNDRTTYDDEGRVIATSRVTIIDSIETVLDSTSTEYNAAGRVTRRIDRSGIETRYVYDLRGQLVETRRRVPDENDDLMDVVTLTVYDDAGRTIFTSDPVIVAVDATILNSVRGTRSIYDAAGRVTASSLNKNVIVSREGSGITLRQFIDDENVVNEWGDVISSTQTVYGTAGRIDYTVDTFGAETHFTYNAFGDQVESRTEVKDAAGDTVWMITRTVYDSRGRVELATDAYVDGATSSYATRTIYDTQGRVVGSERRAGVVVSIVSGDAVITNRGSLLSSTATVFDAQGRVAKTIAADGQETTYEYDALNRRAAVIASKQTIDGVSVRHRMETHYNALGQIDYERDNIIQFDNDTTDDSAARTTSYEYDLFGNRIVTTLSSGTFNAETSCEYDSLGRKTSETDAVGNVTTFEYDAQGRLIAVELPAVPDPLNGNTLTHPRYEYAYDAQGNQTLIRDARGRETLFTYDEQGRQLSRTLPLGASDAQDLIDLDDDVRDLAGVTGKFTEGFWYDDRGRQTLHVSFEGVVTRYLYDDDTGAQGRLVESQFYTDLTAYDYGTGTPAETVEYAYDAFGRQLSVTMTNASGARVDVKTYGAEGRLATASTPEGVITYVYDVLGRKSVTKVYAAGADPAEDAPQRVTAYTYDQLSRLATVTDDFDPASTSDTPLEASYGYDLLGSLDRTDLPNGVVEKYTYDELERLDKVTHYAPDSTPANLANNQKLAEFDYTVRDDGKRTAATETFFLDSNSDSILEPHVNEISWDYDAAGRLVEEVFDHFDDNLDQTESFVYDLVGNRLSMTKDAGNDTTIDEAIAYLYDDNDRLTTEELDLGNNSTVDQTTTYSWNETQQASKTVENASSVTQSVVSYSHDLQGRMAQVVTETYTSGTLSHRERVTYGYDATGIRISSLVEADANVDDTYELRAVTEYLFDHANFTDYEQAIEESTYNADTDGISKTVEYTFGHDEIAQTVKEYDALGIANPTVTHSFGHDGHGSVRALFDATVAIAQLFAFDAYGQLSAIHLSNASFLSASASNSLTSLLYCGERFDTNSQQQYLRSRYYDSSTGRFSAFDTFRGFANEPQSFHKFVYVNADPINGTDPSGYFAGGLGGLSLGTAVSFSARGAGIGASVGFVVGFTDAALGGANLVDSLFAGVKGAVVGGLFGAITGPIWYVALAASGPAQALAITALIYERSAGIAMGFASVNDANNNVQGGFRVATTYIGALLGLSSLPRGGTGKGGGQKLAYTTTNGTPVEATPERTTTVLGRFVPDMDNIIKEINPGTTTTYSKTISGTSEPGRFNVLNAAGEPGKLRGAEWWWKVNLPWLLNAILRGDRIILASPPTQSNRYTAGSSQRTTYGRELALLELLGFRYDPSSGEMLYPSSPFSFSEIGNAASYDETSDSPDR